jgi:hypothetical protein
MALRPAFRKRLDRIPAGPLCLPLSIAFDLLHLIPFFAICKGHLSAILKNPVHLRAAVLKSAPVLPRQFCILTGKQNHCTNIASKQQ